MAQRAWGGRRCDKLTQTGNFYPCRRYPCAAIVPEVVAEVLVWKDWRAEWESGDLDLGFHAWALSPAECPHPPPNQPPTHVGQADRRQEGGSQRAAGRQSAHTPTLAQLPARCLFRENIRSGLHRSVQEIRRTSHPPPISGSNMVHVHIADGAVHGSLTGRVRHLALAPSPASAPALGYDTHFPAAATPVLSTKIVVNIKYRSICLIIY